MAVVEFTPYTDREACSRSVHYIIDGHGLPAADRTNRYVSGGHTGITLAEGHLCPSDPSLATAYMESLRWNYERQHPPGENRKKGSVTHVQIYVSPTEEDRVPPEERMKMTRELIQRTALRDFPCVLAAHDNTDVGHCHISICPYAPDGSHKLCINNKLLHALRREMDYICYEHGYSIIDNPALRHDPEYRAWFEQVQTEGKITIHPPRKAQKSNTRTHKRARDYDQSKRAKRKRKEEREEYFRLITSVCIPETEDCFYESPYLFHPQHPDQPIRLKALTPDGKTRPELELQAAALGSWALLCRRELEQRKMEGTEKLRKKLDTIHKIAYQAIRVMQELDIRTQAELIHHIKEVGQDIGTLKRSIRRWEAASKDHTKTETQLVRIQARKVHNEALLEKRSREYRKLKYTEKVLHPASNRDAWEACLEALSSGAVKGMAYSLTGADLERRIYDVGNLMCIPDEELDRLVIAARDHATHLRFSNRKTLYRKRNTPYDRLEQAANLFDLSDRLARIPIFGFLAALLVETIAEIRESASRMDLEIMQWCAIAERVYRLLDRNDESEYYQECVRAYEAEAEKEHIRVMQMLDQIMDISGEKVKHPIQETKALEQFCL